jgi:cyclopropane-fatty-acyl-phospholipid synthase
MAVSWTETGLVPDPVIRSGIRRLLESKRREVHAGDIEYAADELNRFVSMLDQSPIAMLPELANEQHYDVSAGFFTNVMGDHLKYSCGYWPDSVTTPAAASSRSSRASKSPRSSRRSSRTCSARRRISTRPSCRSGRGRRRRSRV